MFTADIVMHLITSVNELLTVLISKASPGTIDALIVKHEARLDKLHAILDKITGN